MKVLTTREAYDQIIQVLDSFQELVGQNMQGKNKMHKIISNVGFVEFFSLYKMLKSYKKRLYMPGEVVNECMLMVYSPHPNFTIIIESEPCVLYKFKGINKINYN